MEAMRVVRAYFPKIQYNTQQTSIFSNTNVTASYFVLFKLPPERT